MPASKGYVPLDRLREAVAGGIETRSLRQVARDVGMSPSGLQKFLDGARPYSATRRKLERWYVREVSRYGGELSAGSALAAIRVLAQDLPPGERKRIEQRMLDLLEAGFREGGKEPPAWLRELREEADEP